MKAAFLLHEIPRNERKEQKNERKREKIEANLHIVRHYLLFYCPSRSPHPLHLAILFSCSCKARLCIYWPKLEMHARKGIKRRKEETKPKWKIDHEITVARDKYAKLYAFVYVVVVVEKLLHSSSCAFFIRFECCCDRISLANKNVKQRERRKAKKILSQSSLLLCACAWMWIYIEISFFSKKKSKN